MDIEYVLNCSRKNKAISNLLSNEKIIKKVIENNKEDEVQNGSFFYFLINMNGRVSLCVFQLIL
jgi:hypothetical protein